MLWFWLALASASLWGLVYALTDKLLERFDLFTLLFAQYMLGAVVYGIGFLALRQTGGGQVKFPVDENLLYFFLFLLATLLANVLILMSISHKNGTASGMVEIAAPLFTAAFAYLLFRDVQLTLPLLIGGFLIMSGIFVMFKWN